MPRYLVPAFSLLGEAVSFTTVEMKAGRIEADADTERTAGVPATVLAVAVVRRAN
jgi:hypothetical protein